jgi:hypothetical protein
MTIHELDSARSISQEKNPGLRVVVAGVNAANLITSYYRAFQRNGHRLITIKDDYESLAASLSGMHDEVDVLVIHNSLRQDPGHGEVLTWRVPTTVSKLGLLIPTVLASEVIAADATETERYMNLGYAAVMPSEHVFDVAGQLSGYVEHKALIAA